MPPKPTGQILKQLRDLMINPAYVKEPLSAYIVPSNDAHFTEYVAECDQFRGFVSGFDGSAGTAVITQSNACLWTDGRYFLQASQQIDDNWTLMKEGVPSTPTIAAWLDKVLPANANVGVDPKLFTLDMWDNLNNFLESTNHKLVPVAENLISVLWQDRPKRPTNLIKPLPLKYSGQTVGSKISFILKQLKDRNCSALIISTLDDVAWTLNLRGSDIEYNPLFFSYLIIQENLISIFVNVEQIDEKVRHHLKEELNDINFVIHPYEHIEEYLKSLEAQKIWIPDNVNYALAGLFPQSKQHNEINPTILMKAVKNETEINGMRNAHVKDAAALCCYFAWLEENVPNGGVTEVSGASKLEEFRKLQEDFVGPSFATISSSGPNGAIIHYHPTEGTDRLITTSELYLCDSGAQFLDGTTDVTRTMHFGEPTDHEKECYTRVLKGQLKLGNAVFPSKIKGNYLDSFAREFLWEVGLDYSHGTSHGIGSYLNVHEGPMGISWRPYPEDPGLEANMFLSNEPGYYEDGKFGIRIEDIVQIVPIDLPNNFNNRGFLTFDTITLCPKQTKLIKVEMLTDKEIELLNNYHKKCRSIVGPLLEKQGHIKARDWLFNETEELRRN